MPLTKLQSHVLRLIASERSPDSHIAGGVAINREGPRFSGDSDIFQDTEQRLQAAAADEKTLTAAGLRFSWKKIVMGKNVHNQFRQILRRLHLSIGMTSSSHPDDATSPSVTKVAPTAAA